MEALVTIKTTHAGPRVSARELYNALGLHSAHWAKWKKKNIEKNQFAIEGQDWVLLTQRVKTPEGGRPTDDFLLTMDFAKRLAMMTRTETGEKVRSYFLACEEHMKQQAHAPLSPAEQLLYQAQLMVENERRVRTLEESHKTLEIKVNEMEAKASTTPADYYAVSGFARLNKIPVDMKLAISIGKMARSLCVTNGYSIGRVPDAKYGQVNTYPKDVLSVVFKEVFPDKSIAA